jgi:hypothetical protein
MAALPSWAGVLAGAEAGADEGGLVLGAIDAGVVGCGEVERAEPGADAVGAGFFVPAWRARAAACRGGTVTTAGATATAMSAGLAAQAAVSAAPHPAAAGCWPADA